MRSYQDLRREVAALGRQAAQNATLRSEKESLESVLQAAHVKLSWFGERKQALEAQLAESSAEWGKRLDEERARRAAAERTTDEEKAAAHATMGEFADLKERLAAALARVAQLEGYIDRVREEGCAQPRVIPPPSPFALKGLQSEAAELSPSSWRERDRDISPGRDTHWTHYGQHS